MALLSVPGGRMVLGLPSQTTTTTASRQCENAEPQHATTTTSSSSSDLEESPAVQQVSEHTA